jgi:hypothetical protein
MKGLDYAEQHYDFIDKTRVRAGRELRRLHGELDTARHTNRLLAS